MSIVHACKYIDVVKSSWTVISLSYLLICFRSINHMAINHLYSASDVRHRHVWHNTPVHSVEQCTYVCIIKWVYAPLGSVEQYV
jgi:hypothetical protein